jgi:magnesium transporter
MITLGNGRALASMPVRMLNDGIWINAVDPSPAEVASLKQLAGVPAQFVQHALDLDELARMEHEGATTLMVVRIPFFQGFAAAVPYTTIPFAIILTERQIVTICRFHNDVVQEMLTRLSADLPSEKAERIILHILLYAADRYLVYLRDINAKVDTIEAQLPRSLRNKEVLELLKYQKSLTYFTTALKLNEIVLERLQKSQLLRSHPEDDDLVEDVLVETRQAIEMTSIAGEILSQMMDAFASIISNNLNVVMKFLAAFTIILTFPTMVASFYGMNIGLPGQTSPYAFAFTLVASLVLSLVVAIIFWRKGWL